jgi:hypothetical protein
MIRNAVFDRKHIIKFKVCKFCFALLEERTDLFCGRKVHVEIGTDIAHSCQTKGARVPFPTAYDMLDGRSK